jgi:A/G-specific adenine glycosylase
MKNMPAPCADDSEEFRNLFLKNGLTQKTIRNFQKIIYRYYRGNSRDMLPWRNTKNPYHILVSEIMLQQTQVERVIQKYEQFITAFPDIRALANAPLRKILMLWQGLGYNRRAIALKNAARKIMREFPGGEIHSSVEVLMALPGVGRSTASAVSAFAYGKPVVFAETNIRRVYIHFFFRDHAAVRDKDLLAYVEKTLDVENPRRWYYALMDYGAMLRKLPQNPNRKSTHYRKQTSFHGSNRQLRGLVLRTILQRPSSPESELLGILGVTPAKYRAVLEQLLDEGFVRKSGKGYKIL